VLREAETYMTAAGPVRVERTLYKDRTDEGERAISAMELNVGVVAGLWTPLAAKETGWVVSQMGWAQEGGQAILNLRGSHGTTVK
jgi:hypothetical protein